MDLDTILLHVFQTIYSSENQSLINFNKSLNTFYLILAAVLIHFKNKLFKKIKTK